MDAVTCEDQAESYTLEIPFYYTIIFTFIIFICSIFYFFKLKWDKNIYIKQGRISSHFKEYFKILFKFRNVYGLIFTQLFDQISDLSVIIQLYSLSFDDDSNFECYHMNVKGLFGASVFIFIFYRFLSSFLVFHSAKDSNIKDRLKLSFLQFFDLTFILTLRINYKFQHVTPCSPQRYITNLEAVYEACPQFLLQSFFLLTLNMNENKSTKQVDVFNVSASNLIVFISILFSLWSILSKKLAQDKELVKPDWQDALFAEKKIARVNITPQNSDDVLMQTTDTHICFEKIECCGNKHLNTKFIERSLWRLCTILYRLCLFLLGV